MGSSRIDRDDKLDRQAIQLLRDLWNLEEWATKYGAEGKAITGFSVRLPKFEGDDVFIVVRGLEDGEKVVAFRDGEDTLQALRNMLRAIRTKKLKWRPDKYE